jgi:SAM-dependent methyltransferase
MRYQQLLLATTKPVELPEPGGHLDSASSGGLDSNLELARIREAYERRKQTVPHDRYLSFKPGRFFLVQELERNIVRLFWQKRLLTISEKRILEVGCGDGYWLRAFVQWGASPENLCGIDLLSDKIASAQRLCPPHVRLECGDASHLPFCNDSLDIVVSMTVFSSILDPTLKLSLAREMVRVLRPEGSILWYDFHMNNPWNPDVRGIPRHEISQLFPGCRIETKRVTLAPPLGRAIARFPILYDVLACTKLLCTHYLGWISKT